MTEKKYLVMEEMIWDFFENVLPYSAGTPRAKTKINDFLADRQPIECIACGEVKIINYSFNGEEQSLIDNRFLRSLLNVYHGKSIKIYIQEMK